MFSGEKVRKLYLPPLVMPSNVERDGEVVVKDYKVFSMSSKI
jgi:hypothetical protein